MKIALAGINISKEKGTIKLPVNEILIDSRGLESDAHAGNWHRQVSILGAVSINEFSERAGRKINPGEFAENLIFQGIDLPQVSLLDRFRIGNVLLEVTQIGKKCHGSECAVFREVGDCVMPREGIFARVLETGKISVGDEIEYIPKPFVIKIITLSDRASRKEYEDLSGPEVERILTEYFKDKRWHIEMDYLLMPDDREMLKRELEGARQMGIDVVIATGGTGIGPRDFTPDVVMEMSDKIIPGIMEQIRLKYGAEKPNALLSRSVAAVLGNSLVYSIPGSVKAVREYMTEILKSLEHTIEMLRGLGH